MIERDDVGDVRRLPIVLIDEPALAMRETMSDAGLDGLVESFKRHGQLQNIGVIVTGDRFRVAYGHRRRVAAARAGLTHLLARVFAEGTPDEEAIKVDENAEQEPVNAAAEATYYRYLLDERCDGDVGKLVALVRRKESFVLSRLDLTQGDELVLQALRDGAINLSCAVELNKVSEELYRRLWLHDCVRQGLKASAIRVLRQNRDRERRVTEVLNDPAVRDLPPSTVTPIESMDACTFCRSASDQHEMTYVKVHRSCLAVYNRDDGDRGAGRS